MVRMHPIEQARLYLVRHADAGLRGHDPGDHLRPLSPDGRVRARTLAQLLGQAPIGDIVSSPYVRCVETVEPLAARHRRHVALSDALAEGAGIRSMLGLLRLLPDGSVACTHGDMLAELAGVIADTRIGHSEPISFDKGGVWVLSRNDMALSLVDQIRASGASNDHRSAKISHTRAGTVPRPPRPGLQRSIDDGEQEPIEEEQEASACRGR